MFGIGIGFCISRFSLSLVFLKLLKLIFSKIKFGFLFLLRKFYNCFDFFEANTAKILKKSGKTLKKGLKKLSSLLYTKEDRKV